MKGNYMECKTTWSKRKCIEGQQDGKCM